MVRALITVAALAVLAGCGGSGAAKLSGETPGATRTLTLANGNDSPFELQPWLDEVDGLSKGRLRIRVRSNWRLGEPGYEAGLIADVRAGRIDLGWVGARAWTAEGVRSFDALDVPFLVDSYAAEDAVLGSPEARRMLAGVAAAGVQPIGLLPGPLRLLLARRPVRSVRDLQGLEIGVGASEVGERGLRELGAIPAPLARGASMGSLDAVEGRLGTLAAAYVYRARYLMADAPLWPRPIVLFANRRAWARLDERERGVLEAAAARAFAPTLRAEERDDRARMDVLCDANVRLVTVGAEGRAALRDAVAPLSAEVRANADARAGLRAVERARANAQAPAQLACKQARPAAEPALTGTFEWTLRRGEPGTPRGFDFEGANHVRFRVMLQNGRAVETEVFPDGHSELGFDEIYSVYRDRIRFGGDHGDQPLTARWQLDGNRLRFTEMNGGPDDHFVWASHTWVRVHR
jgi:TRAP-type C4-dicarboxylate transport system substrate-binding protein